MREIGLESDPSLVVEGDHTMEGGMAAFTTFTGGRDPSYGGSVLE